MGLIEARDRIRREINAVHDEMARLDNQAMGLRTALRLVEEEIEQHPKPAHKQQEQQQTGNTALTPGID